MKIVFIHTKETNQWFVDVNDGEYVGYFVTIAMAYKWLEALNKEYLERTL